MSSHTTHNKSTRATSSNQTVRDGVESDSARQWSALPDATLSPREQFDHYAAVLVQNDGFAGRLVEVRPVETWTVHDKKRSRVVTNRWLTPNEFKTSYDDLRKLNETANIFVGVNPRASRQSTKAAVHEAICMSADLDYCTTDAARLACLGAGLPEPTMLVDSGHGSHVYYLFDAPYRFITQDHLARFEEAGRGFHRAIGADCTHDVTRLLRVPGLANNKDFRNGASPIPCTLVQCDAARLVPASLFLDRWRPEERPSRPISLDSQYLPDARTERRIKGLVNYLANDGVSDRSRRDFGVLAGLLRLGLSPEEIWPLVQQYSKFATDGERYFRTTIANAQRAVEEQSFFE